MERRDNTTFVEFVQERGAFGLSEAIWQSIYNGYCTDCAEISSEGFYLYLKDRELLT